MVPPGTPVATSVPGVGHEGSGGPWLQVAAGMEGQRRALVGQAVHHPPDEQGVVEDLDGLLDAALQAGESAAQQRRMPAVVEQVGRLAPTGPGEAPGPGIAWVPRWLVDPADTSLQRILGEHEPNRPPIHLVHPQRRILSPCAKLLTAHLVRALGHN